MRKIDVGGEMWIDPKVFEWQGIVQGSSVYTDDSWKRVHQIWTHAEQILNKQTNELERTNAILDLRRAIDRRVRLLNERYSFRSIPIRDKPTDTLKLLEYLGVVRPRMLQKLIDIRNAVEHEDVEPPDEDLCQVFLEFTWYFLRSTDLMVQKVVDSILFEDNEGDDNNWVEISIHPPDIWIPTLRGWLSPDLISIESKENWIPLKVVAQETRKEAVQRLERGRTRMKKIASLGWGEEDDDVYFTAQVRGPSDMLKRLYNLYFEIVW